MFFKGSRYEKVGELIMTDAAGNVIRYKAVRFVPPTPAVQQHVVGDNERLDRLAYRYFKDTERFWRICDANAAMWPPDLLAQIGRRIGIPRSEA
jgi:hypothetical protein